MSVINQVLNQLEQRGAHTSAEQTMVRPVPKAKRKPGMPLLAFGLVMLAGIAVWLAVQPRKPVLSSVEGPDAATATVTPKAAQGANHAPDPDLPSGSMPQLQSVMPSVPVSGVSVPNLPASRLSFELSSVPLPSTMGQVSKPAVAEKPVATVKSAKKSNKKKPGKTAKKSVKARPAITTKSDAEDAVQTANGAVPMKQISTEQRADAEYRKATALMQQGRTSDAISGYREALRLDPGHDAARQALVAVLLENKRGMDAERVLQDRLKSKPDHTGFTMMLARLQVERGAVAEATATLQKALPYANSQADYQAFLAALLQRQNRNEESIAHYQSALQLVPNNGIWLMGYGISLQAMQRKADAKAAYQHALDSQTLSTDLQAFVRQKLKEL